MRIDFNQEIKDFRGEPMKGPDGDLFCLRDAAVMALDLQFKDSPALEAKEKYRRGDLARRIFRAREAIELEVGDVALIKEVIGKAYGPKIVVEAWDILENGTPAPPDPTLMIPKG